MSDLIPALAQKNASKRVREPGVEEFHSLLNQLPDAALVLETNKLKIFLANSVFLKMTAYSLVELNSFHLRDLLSSEDLDGLPEGEWYPVMLSRRSRTSLPVMVRRSTLDPQSQRVLLSFQTFPAFQQSQGVWKEKLIQSALELAGILDASDLEGVLGTALKTGSAALNTNMVCIYQTDPQAKRLIKISTHEGSEVFPNAVSLNDMELLKDTTLWVPGRKVQSELQRRALVSGLSYLATVPLGEPDDWFGLLVFADKEKEPADFSMPLVRVLGLLVNGVIKQFRLIRELGERYDDQEKMLEKSETIFENSPEGVIILTPGLKIREINPAAEWMLGYANNEAMDQPVDNILIGPDRLTPSLEAAVQGIPTHNLGNVSLHKRNGQLFPAQVQIMPIRKKNDLSGIVVFVSDISENEQIKEHTQQLEQRAVLGEFTAIFAHEVRNPINNISTGLQLLSSKLQGEDPNQDLISRMQADCVRLDHLMESVLAFSKPIGARLEKMDVGAAVFRVLDRWRPRLLRLKIESFFEKEEKLPRILGDPRALDQVFTNLITNATDAMGKTGGNLAIRIGINTETPNIKHVEITISDNGPGIPTEVKDRIFEPFITTKTQGTGLGLAITKRIIIAHKGNITLESFPGGTIFHVYLPAITGD